jgi:hypothetical protein
MIGKNAPSHEGASYLFDRSSWQGRRIGREHSEHGRWPDQGAQRDSWKKGFRAPQTLADVAEALGTRQDCLD